MALSGRSSLERTNGRPLCPQCRAPMWSVRAVSIHTMCAFPPLSCALHMSAFDPKRTSRPTLRHFTHLIGELDCLTSRISALNVGASRAKLRRSRKLSSDCPGNSRKDHREISNLCVRWTGRLTAG